MYETFFLSAFKIAKYIHKKNIKMTFSVEILVYKFDTFGLRKLVGLMD